MAQAWNPEEKFFAQSYDDKSVLDSAVLIMPLVFFCPAVCVFGLSRSYVLDSLDVSQTDNRFLGTLHRILKSPERGGLTANVNTAH